MSAFGTKRTSRGRVPMSAFGGKADIVQSRHPSNAELVRVGLVGRIEASQDATRMCAQWPGSYLKSPNLLPEFFLFSDGFLAMSPGGFAPTSSPDSRSGGFLFLKRLPTPLWQGRRLKPASIPFWALSSSMPF